jgi:DNA repair exonuclease SbcCD ATPase subunit
MKIAYVAVSGFRGFREPTRFEFEPDIGFVVFSGPNGVGKSTICDAIEYAITGAISKYEVARSGRESVADYVWWRGSDGPKECWVEVGLIDEDGTRLNVRRSKHEGPNVRPERLVTALCASGPRPEDPLNQLARTLIIRDEWIARWSLDLSAEDRFNFVRDALGITSDNSLIKRAEEVISAASAAYENATLAVSAPRLSLQRAIAALTEARSQIDAAPDVGQSLAFFVSLGIDSSKTVTEQIAAATKLVEDRRTVLAQFEQALAKARNHKGDLTVLSSGQLADALADAQKTAAELDAQRAAVNQALESARKQLENERGADQWAINMAQLLEHGERVGLQHNHCPLCDAQRTDDEFRDAISRARDHLSLRERKVAELRRTLEAASGSERALLVKISEARAAMGRITQQHTFAERIRTEIELAYRLAGIAVDPGNLEAASLAFAEKREEMVRMEQALTRLHASRAIEQVAAAESNVQALREEVELAEAAAATFELAQERAKRIRRAALSAVNEMVDERLWAIGPLLSELYGRLRPHVEWKEIDYKLRGDIRRALNLTVGENLNPQFVFSSGQRRAAGLAFLLAVHLSRPWCKLRTLVLDDPVQHIDDYRAINLVEVLVALRKQKHQIIVAVEDRDLANLLSRRMQGATEARGKRIDLDISPTGGGEIVREQLLGPLARDALHVAV